ncbi:MAG: sensitivity to high expression protein she9 [Bogoriella megaspora]|nr:MAG: sensitivity to high expression protein she9 [Bogoriella megaspora]
MKPLLGYGSRLVFIEATTIKPVPWSSVLLYSRRSDSRPFSVCFRCQARAFLLQKSDNAFNGALGKQLSFRSFSTQRPRAEEQKQSQKAPRDDSPQVSEPNLPSHLEKQRTIISKRLSTVTDSLLDSLSRVSHRVNTYTGTDYSAIETLRASITSQESNVRSLHSSVASAKETYDTAHARQIAAQKEVVGLLERKSSWSAPDLERYMSLIRSEHVNEQDVATSLVALRDKERELEEGRRQLEKMERQQYHEEQIWSDTIRRNSTWVTIGLMGVNILLLLVNIVGVEPWRRRRLVKEVKRALDEKSILAGSEQMELERSIAEETEPKGATLENVEREKKEMDAEIAMLDVGVEGTVPVPLEAEKIAKLEQKPATETEDELPPKLISWKEYMQDMFSERLVALRRVDITYVALQGAATGVAFMGILFVLLRPK